MNRLVSLLAGAAVVVALRADARACDPVAYLPHTVDSSLQASDQTPPTLPAIPAPVVHRAVGSQNGCERSDCGSLGTVMIQALATDDTTAPGKIGYRFSLAAGRLPAGLTLSQTAFDAEGPTLILYFDTDNTDAIDFTLQVVAIDHAGNESTPQTVRVFDESGAPCAVARGPDSRDGFAAIAVVALLVAARRRRPA